MRYSVKTVLLGFFFGLMLFPQMPAAQDGPYIYNQFPSKGKVTMIDLVAEYCLPCQMMVPILNKIKKNYQEKADIIFIDVHHNREQALRFGVRVLPTQIFFDANQKEVFRHEGFMGEQEIVSQLTSMGVQPDQQ